MLGETVLYKLSRGDADAINAIPAHHRNPVEAGQVLPAVVVRDWGGSVNLQVFLDGKGSYWATSRKEGSEPFEWSRRPDAVIPAADTCAV